MNDKDLTFNDATEIKSYVSGNDTSFFVTISDRKFEVMPGIQFTWQ